MNEELLTEGELWDRVMSGMSPNADADADADEIEEELDSWLKN